MPAPWELCLRVPAPGTRGMQREFHAENIAKAYFSLIKSSLLPCSAQTFSRWGKSFFRFRLGGQINQVFCWVLEEVRLEISVFSMDLQRSFLLICALSAWVGDGQHRRSTPSRPSLLASQWVWSSVKAVYVSTAEFIAQPGLLQLIISQTNNLSLGVWGSA